MTVSVTDTFGQIRTARRKKGNKDEGPEPHEEGKAEETHIRETYSFVDEGEDASKIAFSEVEGGAARFFACSDS